jgi:hypothetical protein
MIRYALACDHEHEFEGWFGASADFDEQQAKGQIECPVCASKAVRKQIMAPAVAGTKRNTPDMSPQMRQVMMETLGKRPSVAKPSPCRLGSPEKWHS